MQLLILAFLVMSWYRVEKFDSAGIRTRATWYKAKYATYSTTVQPPTPLFIRVLSIICPCRVHGDFLNISIRAFHILCSLWFKVDHFEHNSSCTEVQDTVLQWNGFPINRLKHFQQLRLKLTIEMNLGGWRNWSLCRRTKMTLNTRQAH